MSMISENLNKIAEALLLDYENIYYVNAVTNEYEWFSINQDTKTLQIEEGGKDFFEDLKRDAEEVIHEDDKHIFLHDLQKDNLMEQMQKGTMQSIVYRHVIDGKTVWHSLRLIRGFDEKSEFFILGVLNIDNEVRKQREQDKLKKEAMTFNDIAARLAERYNTIFYVDTETDYYVEFSSTDIYRALEVPAEGKDFFEESVANANRVIYKDDKEAIIRLFTKKIIQEELKKSSMVQLDYRLVMEDQLIYLRLSIMYTMDKKHIMYCIEDRQVEHETEEALRAEREKNKIYSQVAESLASYYDTIYYVNSIDNSYVEFESSDIYKGLHVPDKGGDFFAESRKNIMRVVYPSDREKVLSIISKDYILEKLKDKRLFTERYRLIIDDKTKYTRLSVMWAQDREHMIVGIENIDDQVRALKNANEKATRDELTGVRNKNAFQDYEKDIQKKIDSGEMGPFAMVMCDLNNLKLVNDTMGHKAGDKYIKDSCKMICHIYKHSPVFRIGGDEFVVVLSGEDYDNKDSLFGELRNNVLDNKNSGSDMIIASGMAVYDADKESSVNEVFERADKLMYENKRVLKDE